MGATVILSPHRDDAVLSLWHVLAGPGDVGVVNVFSGAAAGAAPGWWDEISGAVDPLVRAREREREDYEALALVGRAPVSLDFLDDQYRSAPQELAPVLAALAAVVDPGDTVLAPAALGDHRDHDLLRAAALKLRERGQAVALYADIPHAAFGGWPAWVANGAGPPASEDRWTTRLVEAGLRPAELEPRVHCLAPAAERRKRDAVGRYTTQVGALQRRCGLLSRPDLLRYEIVWPLPAVEGAR
jgi:LmbE family N-acetylglucosaminyl deacetylase